MVLFPKCIVLHHSEQFIRDLRLHVHLNQSRYTRTMPAFLGSSPVILSLCPCLSVKAVLYMRFLDFISWGVIMASMDRYGYNCGVLSGD